MRHFLNLLSMDRSLIEQLHAGARQFKAEQAAGRRSLSMAGQVLGLVFEKPSLRTRVSFQAAMAQMGGSSVYLSGHDAGLGTRETTADFARVMTQYVNAVVLRTFAHATVEEFARHARCPVINGLSDDSHPCQALADLFTIREHFGDVQERHLVFVGDGNNMARSLAVGCAHLGMRFTLVAPSGYRFEPDFLHRMAQRFPRDRLPRMARLDEAIPEADVVYTDVWTSMGQELEREDRLQAFAPYQLNARACQGLRKEAIIMHCLPAHRGEEITDEVIDGPNSVVFIQAGNRLHVQKALLAWLLQEPSSRA